MITRDTRDVMGVLRSVLFPRAGAGVFAGLLASVGFGEHFVEVATPGYARKLVTWVDVTRPGAGEGCTSFVNDNEVAFDEGVLAAGIGIFDAPIGGNLLFVVEFKRPLLPGESVTYAPGCLDITED